MNRSFTRILFSVCLAMPLAGIAQPKLNLKNNNRIGNVARKEEAALFNTNNGSAGPNQTWDYSALSPISSSDTAFTRIIRPEDAPHAADFPKAERVFQESATSFTYEVMRNDTLFTIGVADTSSGLLMKYPAPVPFLRHDMTYGDSLVTRFRRSYVAAGYPYSGTVTSRIQADGYGTLILPTGTFSNVLRIRYEEVSQDTLQMNGSELFSSMISYRWYDANHWSPLLSRDSLAIRSQFYNDDRWTIEYLISETLDVPEAASLRNDFLVYESGNQLYMRPASAIQAGGNFQSSVFSADGKQVSTQRIPAGQSGQTYALTDISMLPSGIYFVRCTGAVNGSVKFWKK